MKIINEKGKLFGIINLVDLLVILFVLLVVGGVAWKIFGTQVSELVTSTKDITYTVRIRGTFDRYYDSLVANEFPQQLTTSEGYVADAYIVDAERIQYVTQVTTDDGRIVDALDGTKIDILVTIEANVSDTTAMKVGSQEIRTGKDHIVKTKYFEMNGNIESVVIEE